MHTFIELWSYRPAWKELTPHARADYMSGIAPQIEAALGAGVALLACGSADPATDRPAAYDLFAVWSAPDADAVRAFERTIAGTGWYEYFDQVNVSGATIELEPLIATMVGSAGAAVG